MGINRLLKKSQKFLREKGIKDGLPGRTFVKSQGCWNCLHFDRGEIYEKRKVDTGLRDVRMLADLGRTQGQIIAIMAGREVRLTETGSGVCLGGGGKGEFVMAKYHCNRWTGRVAIDRHGDGLDPLPEEIKDMLGDNSKSEPPSVDLEATKVLEAIAVARLEGNGVVPLTVGEGVVPLTIGEGVVPLTVGEGVVPLANHQKCDDCSDVIVCGECGGNMHYLGCGDPECCGEIRSYCMDCGE